MADISPWYFHPTGNTMDVFDHEGTMVREDIQFGTNPTEDNGVWTGDFPDQIYDIIRDELDAGGAPTAYNQGAIAVAATDHIKRGTPPESDSG